MGHVDSEVEDVGVEEVSQWSELTCSRLTAAILEGHRILRYLAGVLEAEAGQVTGVEQALV